MENSSSTTSLVIRFIGMSLALFVAQWFIPYYLLAIGAIIAGLFISQTSTDARNGWVVLAAGVFIAIIGYVSVTYWQTT
jgi:hypothetical protein